MKELFFETIKCEDFGIFNLPYHKKRIAKTISCNFNLEEYIYPPTHQLTKCKLIYDEDGIVNIEYSPYHKKNISSFALVSDNKVNYDLKKVNRKQIDDLFAKKALNDEIIIIKNGLLTDTSIANIAVFYNDKWITPKYPLLCGTTRERYLQEGLLHEENITLSMLKKSTKIGLLNAMIDFDTISNFTLEEIE
jgi:4-amino-4-deoxychorismate lyase